MPVLASPPPILVTGAGQAALGANEIATESPWSTPPYTTISTRNATSSTDRLAYLPLDRAGRVAEPKGIIWCCARASSAKLR